MDRYETHCNPELTSSEGSRIDQKDPLLSRVSGGARKDGQVHRGANSREKKLSSGRKNFPSAEFRFKGSLIRWKMRGFGWMLLKESRRSRWYLSNEMFFVEIFLEFLMRYHGILNYGIHVKCSKFFRRIAIKTILDDLNNTFVSFLLYYRKDGGKKL